MSTNVVDTAAGTLITVDQDTSVLVQGVLKAHIDQGHIRLETLHEIEALNACLSNGDQVVETVGGQHFLDARTYQRMIVPNNKRKA